MRVLVNLNNEFAAYVSDCIEYISGKDSPGGQGLYIETNDRDSDREWIFVPMKQATAYGFIRQAVFEDHIDLSGYDAFEVVDGVVDYESYSATILDDYFTRMSITGDNEKAVELTRLFDLFDTNDVIVVAENIINRLM